MTTITHEQFSQFVSACQAAHRRGTVSDFEGILTALGITITPPKPPDMQWYDSDGGIRTTRDGVLVRYMPPHEVSRLNAVLRQQMKGPSDAPSPLPPLDR